MAGAEIPQRAEDTAQQPVEQQQQKSYGERYAQGGKIGYDDGGEVDDDDDNNVLRDIKLRRMIQLGQDPGQFNPEPRPNLGPPEAKQAAPAAPASPTFRDPIDDFLAAGGRA
jgi:hypothetical protein